jgi:hypothetical protein
MPPDPAEAKPAETTPTVPAAEPVAEDDEAYDKDRAMKTINKLRDDLKEANKRAKLADEFEKQEAQRKQVEMTDLQKANLHATELEARLNQIQAQQMRTDIAHKIGLPIEFADRLKGETPEELEADAKIILELIPKTKPTNPGPANPGANGTQHVETREEKRARLMPGLSGPFASGGGIQWDPTKGT